MEGEAGTAVALKGLLHLKNHRKFSYEIDGKNVPVHAFGVFEYSMSDTRSNTKLGKIHKGLSVSNVRHIIGFEVSVGISTSELFSHHAEGFKEHYEKIAEIQQSTSSKIIYDGSCATPNHEKFTIQKYHYLFNSLMAAARHDYALGVHCSAGEGRTGAALIAMRLFEWQHKVSFISDDAEQIYEEALRSCETQRVKLNLSLVQKESLIHLITELKKKPYKVRLNSEHADYKTVNKEPCEESPPERQKSQHGSAKVGITVVIDPVPSKPSELEHRLMTQKYQDYLKPTPKSDRTSDTGVIEDESLLRVPATREVTTKSAQAEGHHSQSCGRLISFMQGCAQFFRQLCSSSQESVIPFKSRLESHTASSLSLAENLQKERQLPEHSGYRGATAVGADNDALSL